MKCPVCGTNLSKGTTKCYVCNSIVEENAVEEVYTGKTKSKTLAGILMLFGAGDLYLLFWRRFIQKMVLAIFTLGIGTLILQVYDAYKVFTGKIDCDANGIPLV